MKKLLFILCLAPSVANSLSKEEMHQLKWERYRFEVMASSVSTANMLRDMLIELRLIRCKIEPIEQDCFDNQEHKHGDLQ